MGYVQENGPRGPLFVTFEGQELRVESIEQQRQIDALKVPTKQHRSWKGKSVGAVLLSPAKEGGGLLGTCDSI